jgi:hypothetical protein
MREFHKKYAEQGYTVKQVGDMITEAGLKDYKEENILKFAKKKGIAVDLVQEGLTKDKKGHVRYIIPQSKLINLIEDMNIPVSVEQLESAAGRLGF